MGLETPLPIPISPAEAKVLQHLRLGLSNRHIAAALVLSPRTIESHVSNLLAKTGCSNRLSLLVWALGSGAIDGDTMLVPGQAD